MGPHRPALIECPRRECPLNLGVNSCRQPQSSLVERHLSCSFNRCSKLSFVWTSFGTLDHISQKRMNWLELGRIDLIGWFLFAVDDGRELPEMT